jgi:predicted transcriptional regulator
VIEGALSFTISSDPRDSSSVTDASLAAILGYRGPEEDERFFRDRTTNWPVSDDMIQKRRKSRTPLARKPTAHPPRIPIDRKRSGIYLESTEAEQLGVLPHECTRVKDAMSRSVSAVTSSTEIGEAVRLMKVFDVDALLVCNGCTLIGTLCDRDIALANAPPSEAVQRVMISDPSYCFEDDLLIDAHELMRVRGLSALPVKEFSGRLSGIVRRPLGR